MKKIKKILVVVTCCMLVFTIVGSHNNGYNAGLTPLDHFDDVKLPD